MTNPIAAGLPDPRAVTDYSTEYAEVEGRPTIYVHLDAPCVIRDPVWTLVDAATGQAKPIAGVAFDGGESNTVIVFTYGGTLPASVNFIEAPYQDPAVQNFHGGFVRPGARWFRPLA